jgi:uncharacterized membrane-anchored protein
VFGTIAADIPHVLGLPLWLTSGVYLAAVLGIFALWYESEGTLSFAGVTRGRSEGTYWAAVVATFALGTAMGDLTAGTWGLGNLALGSMFCGLIVLPLPARRFVGLSHVTAFWTACVLTRPLGASFADWTGSPLARGGPGVPTGLVAAGWAAAIGWVVAVLAIARRNGATVPAADGIDAVVRR